VQLLKGNRYETTIFTLVSAVVKLSKVTSIPEDRKLFRGLGGMVLPDQFWSNVAECRVTFLVLVKSKELIQASTHALERKFTTRNVRVMKSNHVLPARFLKLGSSLGKIRVAPCDDDVVSNLDKSLPYLRVLSDCKITENSDGIQLVVSLSTSKDSFNEEMQNHFRAKIKALVGEQNVEDVIIQEISEKPSDFKGAVERGFLSTTTEKEIASQYSGQAMERGIVFEICAGRIDVGACIQVFSQYPGEKEYLMPPLSALEVMGEPRIDRTEHGEVCYPLGTLQLYALKLSDPFSLLCCDLGGDTSSAG